ncbi:2-polyprenyl-6-methoxyphenol hydroxylase-like FAD-dependent oxidoreductase [Nocardia kruczakiae]|uniref:2-polyprenyl-6-methoxyphenol hydroxylase-like FAD-dependent oxidoreductase n=1 Tax=Nocardia kruczakiae TaxID=261477 RepID=A0ABU1X995_9NOCA|nr:FAD-dependent monooxygenase [Nocardia kruczakiae]MDR7167113.1 2-polyprenyl-6-methoxyphenol hydroxylase-like FAD-dependent oxidoreductase [Nocardia kruczakiae]
MSENMCGVLISGAGPNGLMLVCELALGGVTAFVLEKLPAPSTEPKANGLVGQVVRLLDMRGLYRPAAGDDAPAIPPPLPGYSFSGLPLDLAELANNPLYGLPIPQPRLVALLAARARELGVTVRWGHDLRDLEAHGDHVVATVDGPDGDYRIQTRYLVAADGGKSAVRKLVGIDFPGYTVADRITRFGHATVPDRLRTPEGGLEIPGAGRFHFGHNRVDNGMFIFAELTPGRPIIGVSEYGTDRVPAEDQPMTFAELRESVERVLGAEVPIEPPTGTGPHALRRTVGQNTRLAERYRDGPVLLLGDSAHIHSAMGGPGLNLGLQDAVNLGWKLAAEVNGWAPAELLDTYESERYPVAERVMMHSLAQSALMAPGPEVTGLRDLVAELVRIPVVAAHLAQLLAGSDIRYDVGDDHRLSGRLVPDYTVTTDRTRVRIADLLHTARPLLIDGTGAAAAAAARWRSRVEIVSSTVTLTDPRPLVGTATGPDTANTPAAILLRPDGYVAWATDDANADGLHGALTRWFGSAPAPVHAR